jgi:hypothetical protein
VKRLTAIFLVATSLAGCGSQGDCRFSRVSPDRGLDHPPEVPGRSWPEEAEDWHARTGRSARYPLPYLISRRPSMTQGPRTSL